MAPKAKKRIAGEVQSQVQQEVLATQANISVPQALPVYRGVAQLLDDGRSHLLVVAYDLEVLDVSGREGSLTPGDHHPGAVARTSHHSPWTAHAYCLMAPSLPPPLCRLHIDLSVVPGGVLQVTTGV
jgi:hypothetical protein